MAARRGRGAVEVGAGQPLYVGAEAVLYLVPWGPRRALAKLRVEKKYRHPSIDMALRWRRTVTEARAIREALEAGVAAPAVFFVDPPQYLIVLEYLAGARKLAEIIEEKGASARVLVARLGEMAATLHEAGIAHGDMTTSNVLVHGSHLYLIDFGLADLGADTRDMAVDLHLFLRSLESTHPEVVDTMLGAFLEGYSARAGREKADALMETVREIRLMGRYREERRTAWREHA